MRGSSGDDQRKILCSVSNHLLARPLTAEIKLLLKFQPRVVVVADKKVLGVGETFTAHCEADVPTVDCDMSVTRLRVLMELLRLLWVYDLP